MDNGDQFHQIDELGQCGWFNTFVQWILSWTSLRLWISSKKWIVYSKYIKGELQVISLNMNMNMISLNMNMNSSINLMNYGDEFDLYEEFYQGHETHWGYQLFSSWWFLSEWCISS